MNHAVICYSSNDRFLPTAASAYLARIVIGVVPTFAIYYLPVASFNLNHLLYRQMRGYLPMGLRAVFPPSASSVVVSYVFASSITTLPEQQADGHHVQ